MRHSFAKGSLSGDKQVQGGNDIDALITRNQDMMVAINIIPIRTDEAVREVENRLLGTVFDIHKLSSQLKAPGLQIVTDTMLNRVSLNWAQGKRTHIFIDEFHVAFENESSAEFFNSAWRQFRKRNAYPNAVSHAQAKKLFIELEENANSFTVCFRNDGDVPNGEITEGGGLGSLRKKIESEGGTMTVKAEPEFSLIVTIPKERGDNL